ncbi:MAG: hypothetical protein KF812_09130 [Fimbriimonadaceae bacterium]|nr:hypothetical protein [Fimbriimonadaceae bacterium]
MSLVVLDEVVEPQSEVNQSERNAWLGWHSLPHIVMDSPVFSGSLGTLLHMVREHKIDLYGVPLSPMCGAFLAYLTERGEIDVDSAAMALTALAYLTERKATLILPRDDEIQNPETDEEFEWDDRAPSTIHLFAPALEDLSRRMVEREALFFRCAPGGQYELPLDLDDTTATDLAKAFARLLARAQPDPPMPLGAPRRSMADQIGIVLRALSSSPRTLDELVPGPITRSEAVWWFLALLELIRLGQAFVEVKDEDAWFRGAA